MKITNLAFVMTDTCSASCDICCYSCTPHKKTVLDKELVKDYIRQASEIGTITHISFTGGEAIIYYDLLKECISYAKELGMDSTLVTNCFWAGDIEKGYEKLKGLNECGLTKISFSADHYHQEFVPIENVKNAIKIAKELGMETAITLMDLKDWKSSYDSIEALRPELYDCDHITEYPVFPAGKAADAISADKLLYTCQPSNSICPFDKSVTILFNGRIMMCCSQFSHNIELAKLGTAGETSLEEAIKNISSDAWRYVLLGKGFGWYVQLAEKLGIKLREKYVVSCQLCYELFSNDEFIEKAEKYVKEEAQRMRVSKLLGR